MVLLLLLLVLVAYGQADIRQQVHTLRSSLEAEYGASALQMRIPAPSRAAILAKLSAKIRSGSAIVMAFTGTSVTAGHDNLLSQAYPALVQELLSGITPVTTHNLAVGNNPAVPYGLCMNTILPEQVDIVAWEQAMNCPVDTSRCVEAFLRHVAGVRDAPVPLVLDPVPDLSVKASLNRTRAKLFTHGDADLHDLYAPLGFHSLIGVEALQGVEDPDQFSQFRMMEQDKVATAPKPWHPGPHGHAYIASILAYNYADLILQAVTSPPPSSSEPPALPSPPLWGTLGDLHMDCSTLMAPNSGPDLTRRVTSGKYFDPRPKLSLAAGSPPHAWEVSLWVKDRPGVIRMLEDGRGMLDRKWTASGSAGSGALAFRFSSGHAGHPMVCSPPESWTGWPAGYGALDLHAAVFVDGQRVEVNKHAQGPCYVVEPVVSAGAHSIKIVAHSQTRVAITHLLWPM